jgi:hypothetical protein
MKMKNLFICLAICLAAIMSTNLSAQISTEEHKYSGNIGTIPIELTFHVPSRMYNFISGTYFYKSVRQDIWFRGEHGVFEGAIKLTESVDGKDTGFFVFNNLDGMNFPRKIVGKWYTMDRRRSYDVTLYKE